MLSCYTAVNWADTRRHEGEVFVIEEVDDLFSLLYFLDEYKLLSGLPEFVTDNPNNIPSSRLFEGDMKFLVYRIDTMEEKVNKAWSAILQELG